MKISSVITLLFAVSVISFFAYDFLKPKGFSDADINTIKTAIKTEFGKRDGITVSEVTMIRESPRKLMGFAKLHFGAPTTPIPKVANTSCADGPRPNIDCTYAPPSEPTDLFSGFHFDITKQCSATMGDGGTLWQCE